MDPLKPLTGASKLSKFPPKVALKADKKIAPTPGFKDVFQKARKEREKKAMTLREFAKLATGAAFKQRTLSNLRKGLDLWGKASTGERGPLIIKTTKAKAKLSKTAEEKEKEFKSAPSEKTVQDFFAKNPNPNDKKFHAFAEKKKVNTHKAEALAYRLATKQVKFQRGGKSNEPGPKHYDPKQMKAGIEVEAEHTPDLESRKKISADHLSEFKDYYIPHLRDLENKLKAKKKGG